MSLRMQEDPNLTGVALLEFRTDWCLYSRLLKPKMAYLAEHYGSCVEVKRLDAGEHKELVARYGIEFVPALLLLNRGRIEEKWYGDTPLRAITKALDRHVHVRQP